MNALKIKIIALAFIVAGSISCKKEDNTPAAMLTPSVVQQGSWRVSLYNDSGNDETTHFTGYIFTFSANGGVAAVKASTTVTGTWSSGTDDSQQKFYLDFGAVSPFDELNDDWHILETSVTKMRLEDVSGGGSGTDLLTFEKN